ncbi:MAG: DMT family transporter [Gemmatimonadales bacterium]
MSAAGTARLRLATAALLFSTGGAAIKAAEFDAWQIAGFRSGIAALTLLLLLPAARRGWTWRAAVVGTSYAATLVLFVLANRLTTAANTIFLQSTAPLYLLLLAPWLLHERPRRRDLMVMAAVGAGLLLFFVGAERPAATAPDPARGDLLAAFSGVCWALTLVGLRWMSRRDPAAGGLGAVVIGNLIAFAGCLPLALPLGSHPASDWSTILYLGSIQIGLAYVFVTSALRELPVFEASLILLLEPALNPLLTWLVHGEIPGAWALAGGAVILAATTVKAWADSRLDPSPSP